MGNGSKYARRTVVHDEHGYIRACSLILDPNKREIAVLDCLFQLDAAEVGADSLEDFISTTEHAWCSLVYLSKVLTS